MYKFVAADVSGSGQKRQQTARACESCRRRKKRCHHTTSPAPPSSPRPIQSAAKRKPSTFQNPSSSTLPSDGTPTSPVGHPRSLEVPSTNQNGERPNTEQASTSPVVLNRAANDDDEREGRILFLEGSSTKAAAPHNVRSQDGQISRYVGDLNPESIFLAATSPNATRGASLDDSIGVWLTSTLSRRGSQATPSMLQSPSSLFYTSGSVVQKVLLPILEQECLATIPASATLETLSKIYFERVHPIFPVIDLMTYENLSLKDPARILLQQGICLAASKNFAGRKHLVLTESEPPLSCRTFGERLSGAMRLIIEMGLVKDKIVLIQALALMSQFTDNPVGDDMSPQLCGRAVHHVQTLGLHLKRRQEDERGSYNTTLLCCIYSIDRMNAAFHGRPTLMHERDLRQDLKNCFDHQEPCFRLFLEIIVLLDKVIALYRPLPGAADLGLDWKFPSFEEVVLKSGGQQIGTSPLATIETLYHAVAILSGRSRTWADPQRSSASYLRQSLSASILNNTIGRELHDQLVLFPFVPYAESLSLSVAYREMRHSRLPLHRARARAQFQSICDVLCELEGTFWSASTAAEMGKKMLKEMDRVLALSASENRRPQHDGVYHPVNGGQADNSTSGIANGRTPGDQIMVGSNDIIPTQPMQDFDLSVFDSINDVDLFGMFDPAFDLDSFDACLEGNLNPTFPNELSINLK